MKLTTLSSTYILFLSVSNHVASAADPTSAAGALPMCAQVCLTSAFYACNCTMLDFNCACTCGTFTPNAKSCIQHSCSLELQPSALNMVSSTCQTVTSTSGTTKPTSAPSTSTSITTTSSTAESSSTTSSAFGGRLNTQSAPTSTPTQIATISSISGSSSTIASDPGGQNDRKSTTTSNVGGTNPTPTTWGPYVGNGTESGYPSQCWAVTATGTARSTCAVQANPFNSIGIDIKQDKTVAFLFWSLWVFLFTV